MRSRTVTSCTECIQRSDRGGRGMARWPELPRAGRHRGPRPDARPLSDAQIEPSSVRPTTCRQ